MRKHLFVFLVMSNVASLLATSTSYQHVKFISKQASPPPPPLINKGNVRSARSFHFPFEVIEGLDEIWPETIFLQPNTNFLDITLGGVGAIGGNSHFHDSSYFSPDFSNGLAYPDPILLTGSAAKRAVQYIYGKGELFFDRIPHARTLLKLQQKRKENGLAPNRLGSLYYKSPFYRNGRQLSSHF